MPRKHRTCPQCGAQATLQNGEVKDPDSKVFADRRYYRHGIKVMVGERQPCKFYACSCCEWCEEVTRG